MLIQQQPLGFSGLKPLRFISYPEYMPIMGQLLDLCTALSGTQAKEHPPSGTLPWQRVKKGSGKACTSS